VAEPIFDLESKILEDINDELPRVLDEAPVPLMVIDSILEVAQKPMTNKPVEINDELP